MLQDHSDSSDNEAERADVEGDGVVHDDTTGCRDRRDPPQGEEDAGHAHTPVERYEKADRDTRE